MESGVDKVVGCASPAVLVATEEIVSNVTVKCCTGSLENEKVVDGVAADFCVKGQDIVVGGACVGVGVVTDAEFVEAYTEFVVDPVEVAGKVDLIGLVCEADMERGDNVGTGGGGAIRVDEYCGKIDMSVHELVVARSNLVQGDGVLVDIRVEGDAFWEKLSENVCIDRDHSTRIEYSELFNCDVPVAVVEVGPYCVAPVFGECVAGTCGCMYKLCGARCQLRPCRFAAAILGFGCDVTRDDVYVLTCAYRGARLVDHGCDCEYEGENYSTITGSKAAGEMNVILGKELSEHKVRVVNSKPRCVHSLGGTEKSNGDLRPITDCSQPEGRSINEFMETTCRKFRYKTVDTVVGMLYPYDFGAVSDISSAYRTIHVLPAHRKFQGVSWNMGQGQVYMEDLRLCFGLRCAPFCFTQFSNFLVKCGGKQGIDRCINYLDDFVVLGSSESECGDSQAVLHRVLKNFGFGLAEKKVTAPAQVFKYLGIIVDSIKMTVSIGEDKVTRVKNEVLGLLDKTECKRKTLEEVTGLLAHCATVVKGGRTFARRIYNTLKAAVGTMVQLDEITRQDLIWWSSFVTWFNGKAKVLGACQEDVLIFSDSSGYGFGAHVSDDYFWGVWTSAALDCPHSEDPPREPYEDHINITELWPVVVAIHRWGVRWRNCSLLFVTDNTQVQGWVNKGCSSNPYAMAWLRELFWVAAFYNVTVRSSRISSEDNILADALSRLNSSDCNVICDSHITSFSDCCRAVRTEGRVGVGQGQVLVRKHPQG